MFFNIMIYQNYKVAKDDWIMTLPPKCLHPNQWNLSRYYLI